MIIINIIIIQDAIEVSPHLANLSWSFEYHLPFCPLILFSTDHREWLCHSIIIHTPLPQSLEQATQSPKTTKAVGKPVNGMNSVGAPPLHTPNYPNQRKVPLKITASPNETPSPSGDDKSRRNPSLDLLLLEIHLAIR